VPVPAGHHEIRLTYTDPNIGRGLLGSAIVWVMWFGALVAAFVVERRSGTRAGPRWRYLRASGRTNGARTPSDTSAP
jgi:hypothetical protein